MRSNVSTSYCATQTLESLTSRDDTLTNAKKKSAPGKSRKTTQTISEVDLYKHLMLMSTEIKRQRHETCEACILASKNRVCLRSVTPIVLVLQQCLYTHTNTHTHTHFPFGVFFCSSSAERMIDGAHFFSVFSLSLQLKGKQITQKCPHYIVNYFCLAWSCSINFQ